MNKTELRDLTIIEYMLGYEVTTRHKNRLGGYVFLNTHTLQLLTDPLGEVFYFNTRGEATQFLTKKFEQHNELEEYAEKTKNLRVLNGSFFKQNRISNLNIAVVKINNK